MKKIPLSILFLLALMTSYSQVIVVRGKGNVTQEDSNLFIGNSFRVPIFNDTASANANRQSLDSSGKVIYTRDLNWFWGRQTSPTRKWIPFNNVANGLNASCGYPDGTHRVTWDSLTTFDVTGGPYILCCDGLPRLTAFTTITLDSNDADDPRIDLIILDSNGVNYRKGTPASNPATPQIDSCEIILSYVLIPAHDSVPSNINSSSNPFVIYDENYDTEAILDSSVGVVYDTADLSNPAHLLNDISVTSFESSNLQRFTLPDSIDLNNYGAFKFYAKKTSAGQIGLTFTWYLRGVQQTFPVTQYVVGSTTPYQIFVVPVSLFSILNSTNVDELYISVSGASSQFFVDWIQLQSGALITNSSTGVTYVGSSNLNPVFNVVVTNPTTTPVLNFSQQNATATTVLGNTSPTDGSYGWVKVNLGTMVDSLLDVFNLFGGSSGDILKNVNGVWTPIPDSSGIADTTFTQNWIAVGAASSAEEKDTLQLGSRYPDSSLLAFDTYVGLDGHSFDILGGDIDFVGAATEYLFNTFGVTLYSQTDADHYGIFTVGVTGASFGSSNAVDSVANIGVSGENAQLNATGIISIVNPFSNIIPAKVWLQASDSLNVPSPTRIAVWDADTLKSASVANLIGAGISADNGLTDSVNRIILGGTLYKTTTIDVTANFELDIIGSSTNTLSVTNVSGNAVKGEVTDGIGIYGVSTTGISGQFISVDGQGIYAQSTNGLGANIYSATSIGAQIYSDADYSLDSRTASATNNAVLPNIKFLAFSSTVPTANGFGQSVDFMLNTTNLPTVRISNQIITKWTDATDATRTSQMLLTGVLSAATVTMLTLNPNGSIQWRPITATEASAITPAEGMQLFVSNTNGTFTSIGMWDYENGAWHKL